MFVEGLRVYGYHGVHPEERSLGQRFVVDVRVRADLRPAAASDEPGETVSYSAVAKRAQAIVGGPPRRLLEAVAEELAGGLLAEFPAASAVTVTLRKPEAPVKGAHFEAVGVRIHRERGGADS